MFSRQHYITFGWVLLVVLVVLNLPERSAVRLKLAISSLFLPLFGIVGVGQGASDHFSNSLTSRSKLAADNDRLRRENQELRAQSIQTESLAQENARLRQAIGWQKRIPGQPRLVRVVGQDPANWWRSVLIDAGSRDGWVRTNMIVVAPEGVVGRISEVGFDRSRILLVGDPNCRFSAQVQSGEKGAVAKGIISPNAGSFDRLIVDLAYLPGGSLVKPGQTVVTSGDGGVFPKGLIVGQIVDVRTNDYGMNLEARVKLAVNLNTLENVWMLTP